MPVWLGRDSSGQIGAPSGNFLDIGLVNNMPGKALHSTERQFTTLIESALDPGITVRLWFYALPDVPRTESGRHHICESYSDIEDLWERHLDGLIVTGMEPRADCLRREPCWPHLERLVEWAEENTYSSIWSCLAAHAAVLHIDGIQRRRLSKKRFGLFECARVSEHPLAAGLPSRFVTPHSRWNDLREQDLAARGYEVISRSEQTGVDLFIKKRKSLFAFLQGHPEYDADTLLQEYVRDAGRYLARESDDYPSAPRGYFDAQTSERLRAIRERGITERNPELLTELRAVQAAGSLTNTWRSSAVSFYRNWLFYLWAAKERKFHPWQTDEIAPFELSHSTAPITKELRS